MFTLHYAGRQYDAEASVGGQADTGGDVGVGGHPLILLGSGGGVWAEGAIIVSRCQQLIGKRVVHVGHDKGHEGWLGFVEGAEVYYSITGQESEWCYVRWMHPNGQIDDQCQRLYASMVLLAE